MTTNDPISDMLTRIRNAQLAGHKTVRVPRSNMKFAIAKILETEGYLAEVGEAEGTAFPELELTLKYKGRTPIIRELKRVSKPGRRIYTKAKDLPRVYSDIGIAILSTPNGVMTNKDARRQRLGGEVLCTIF
ncbi:30S ribosomal protein S8 [Candidatus Uhrbacteria bacterium RIFCSPLOWO2_01_FULL_53_9]|uniref:Small ribosomal subunit protein uS8 n=3 Tax=Candidatus Uhriibacteriota TaxID=1752732 RepID=A0A1F7UWT3_9BACT|nr:MAG: 30S ribosomal protein S8 [Candidatus Uhrbacteria bacterium RIFCSPHIGHO2_02_FULL_53_13]OGL82735.1 MAG: 30S ribosomal protein S8 [Candidatus Uhrbacteria bacterium RIFCSPLOWO2_01_FULL_53_9]OGL89093.1 MAG: 30S ribosomal protein S8 [Candidatus Uhrbacteria bacterium RIFCSPLOWO2_02_FULL_53_10]